LNGDGFSDIVVGAPFYSVDYNEGRAYIFMNKDTDSFSGLDLLKNSKLDGGNVKGARFGTTISKIGDINNDGFEDIAIGAPFGGEDGKGVVFIYNGGPKGLKNDFKPSQILHGSAYGVESFGYSIAGGLDMDGNLYKDIAIGSYVSNKAHVFRTRGTIKMFSDLKVDIADIPSNGTTTCTGSDSKSYFCTNLTLALTYIGGGLNELDFEVTLELDGKVSKRRAFFDVSGKLKSSKTVTLK
jgi:hypothetical protein